MEGATAPGPAMPLTEELNVKKFWELVLFSWIAGDSDTHCKNFSLLDAGEGYQLSPALCLLAVLLADTHATDELVPILLKSVYTRWLDIRKNGSELLTTAGILCLKRAELPQRRPP